MYNEVHACLCINIGDNMDNNGIESLFFSLASESRLDLLQALANGNGLKMNEIARKIDITATEASRQIQRLQDELIIQKQTDGTYTLTNYGRLLLHFFPALEFIHKHKQYLQTHNIWQLPPQFISRLGELTNATECTQMADAVNKIEDVMRTSEDHVWVITDQIMAVHSYAMAERIKKGVKLWSIVHERLVNSNQVQVFGQNVDRRVLPTIPALLVVTEKEAYIALLSIDGKLDYSGFYSSDPAFMKWANDLFLYHWKQTNTKYPTMHNK
jgi:predicted transcriptional regulator